MDSCPFCGMTLADPVGVFLAYFIGKMFYIDAGMPRYLDIFHALLFFLSKV